MFSIETEDIRLELELVPVESLFIHERILPGVAEQLILEFKNLANLENPVIVDRNGIVLDGNHRTYAFKELEFKYIAVGDGSMGSHFIENVGLSIAFKPDENSIKTHGVFSSDQIMNMLYCLGIPKAELDRHLKSGPS